MNQSFADPVARDKGTQRSYKINEVRQVDGTVSIPLPYSGVANERFLLYAV